jgi:hypothetical protein
VNQRYERASARSADGMSERDGSAANVDPGRVKIELAYDSDRLSGERFVQFKEIDLS